MAVGGIKQPTAAAMNPRRVIDIQRFPSIYHKRFNDLQLDLIKSKNSPDD